MNTAGMSDVVAGLVARVREAADAGLAMRRALEGRRGVKGKGPVALLAVGKASVAMAKVAAAKLGERLGRVLIVTLTEHEQEALAWAQAWTRGVRPGAARVLVGSHPTPSEQSVAAARGAMAFVSDGDEEVWVLVSGGGSAMMCLPHEGVALDEVARLTRAIQEAGGTIHELNTVRRHLERIKGGQLAAAARTRDSARVVRAFLLSDVIGDAPETIASGPTAADPTTPRDAVAVIEGLGLREVAMEIAPGCIAFLERSAWDGARHTVPPGDERLRGVENRIIASNALVARAAAAWLRERGLEVVRVEERVEGEAAAIGARLARDGVGLSPGQAIVVAGEWTVDVGAGSGAETAGRSVGGPSQELALAAACALDGVESVRVLAISTDGRDGPTDAAGAVVDGETCARMRAAGIDPHATLKRHDSTRALDAAGGGALIRTGATGTNLNHVAVVWAGL